MLRNTLTLKVEWPGREVCGAACDVAKVRFEMAMEEMSQKALEWAREVWDFSEDTRATFYLTVELAEAPKSAPMLRLVRSGEASRCTHNP